MATGWQRRGASNTPNSWGHCPLQKRVPGMQHLLHPPDFRSWPTYVRPVSDPCPARVRPVSHSCSTCVPLVSHSYPTRVSLVSHSCLARVPLVSQSCPTRTPLMPHSCPTLVSQSCPSRAPAAAPSPTGTCLLNHRSNGMARDEAVLEAAGLLRPSG